MFISDLTCDVIGDPEVNEIIFPLIVSSSSSYRTQFKFCESVQWFLKYWEGGKNTTPPLPPHYKQTPSRARVNPRGAGGEGSIIPLQDFFAITHEWRKLSTRTLQYLLLYQFHTCCEIFDEICRKILVEKCKFYNVTTRDFRANLGQYSSSHFFFT